MDGSRNILTSGLRLLGLPADEQQIQKLLAFLELIAKWNKAYNLTAIRNREQMVRLHLLDSLAVMPYLQGPRVADIGTGAGLPGIPLAVFNRDDHFVLLDSNSKKTRFVQQAVLELQLSNVEVRHCRVEDYTPALLFDTVLCRAFTSMTKIIGLCGHLLAVNGCLLAMKGQAQEEELQEIRQPYSIIPIHVPGIDAERCLVQIQKTESSNE